MMETFKLDDNDSAHSGLVEEYVLGMAAPAWLIVKFGYFPNQAARAANQAQEITLRIDSAHAIELARSILNLTTDPRTATFAQGNA